VAAVPGPRVPGRGAGTWFDAAVRTETGG